MQQAASNVEEIFFAALELQGSEARSAFLNRACGDTELRRKVEQLLALDAGANDFLEAPAASPTVTDAHDSRSEVEEPGTTIGPYKLLEAIGEGGMGTVYMAEQSEPVRRRVALKVIKPGMDTKQVVARFEAERQALAMMDHPNIAKVHDGGTTASGRPYFVMELVRGLPITDYCDREQVPIPERLELFTLVCRAVQHAHQKGIIHRDLKPSNILVTVIDGVAVPKVIDFGVAKATGGRLTDKTLFTGFHQFIGTPLYVSPEQADLAGVDVDTRCDIYSLGVLLYELLTGTTPFDSQTLKRAAFDEMRRIIREDEPPKPSTRLGSLGERLSTVSASRKADPRRLGPSMKGELDWVVMKALEKDRRRRYETANDFAADVMRYLTDRPVEAFPPSSWYRFSKFARRNRVAITTAGLLTAITVTAIAAGTALVWREKEQTRRALLQSQAHARKADERLVLARRAVDEMFTEVAEKWLKDQPKLTKLRRELLGKALAFYEALAAERGGDPAIRLDAARARIRVGHIQEALGDSDRAGDAFRRAVEDLEVIVARSPEVDSYREGLSQALSDLAVHRWQLNQLRDAESLLNRAIEIREKLLAADPENPGHESNLAAGHHRLGNAYAIQGRYAEAEKAFRSCHDLFAGLHAKAPGNHTFSEGLAQAEDGLGWVCYETNRRPEAVQAHRRALAIYEKVLEAHPEDPRYRLLMAMSLINLGQSLGHVPEAMEHDRKAAGALEKLAGEFPEQPEYLETLTKVQRGQAAFYFNRGRYGEAVEVLRLSLPSTERLAKTFPDYPDYQQSLSWVLHALGTTLRKSGKSEEAREMLGRALELGEKLVAAHPQNVQYRRDLSIQYVNEAASVIDDMPDARPADWLRALEANRRAADLEPGEPFRWHWLAVTEYRNGHWDAAIRSTEKCIELRGDPGWAFHWTILALAHAQRGEMDKARAWYAKARPAIDEGKMGDTPPWLIDEAKARFGPATGPSERTNP